MSPWAMHPELRGQRGKLSPTAGTILLSPTVRTILLSSALGLGGRWPVPACRGKQRLCSPWVPGLTLSMESLGMLPIRLETPPCWGPCSSGAVPGGPTVGLVLVWSQLWHAPSPGTFGTSGAMSDGGGRACCSRGVGAAGGAWEKWSREMRLLQRFIV